MYPLDDTIAAIASPPGGAARGILRISGPQAVECSARVFQPNGGRPLSSLGSPHVVAGSLHLPELHSPLPCDVYVWPDGRSYTGQPVAEIHTLGSPPLLQIMLRSLCAAGTRLAGPGEFTLRAFLAGRIDLTQAEAVLGVIDAQDPHELEIALGQLAGGLARPLHRLRDALLDLLAHVEAGFDFADEDLSFITRDDLNRRLAEAENDAMAILRQAASRSEPVDAVRAVLVGRPNTGKSSLFNALAGDRAALVSEHPGTTRDYLVAVLDLEGVKCQLVDMAGARGEGREERGEGGDIGSEGELATSENAPRQRSRGPSAAGRDFDSIERAAQSAAAEQRRGADVQVLCLDSTRPLDAWERGELVRTAEAQRIVVLTKCDAPRQTDCTQEKRDEGWAVHRPLSPATLLETSSVTGYGIAALRNELRRQSLMAGGNRGDLVAGTAARCAESLRLAGECVRRARQAAAAGQEELAAADIRTALDELGKIVGAVYTEDVLDRIFSRFCIGK